MKIFHWVAITSLSISLVGCGGGSAPGEASPEVSVTDTTELKERLQYIAETGQTGSGLSGLPEAIELVSDEATKTALMADYKKLESANESSAKSIAQGMLDKLK